MALTVAGRKQGRPWMEAAGEAMALELRGVDFTSAPSQRKAITMACGRWARDAAGAPDRASGVHRVQARELRLMALHRFDSMPGFSATLQAPLTQGAAAWFGAFDLPFGLPRPFVESLALGASMDAVIASVHGRWPTRMAFRAAIDAWGATQPSGQKLLHRLTDRASGGASGPKVSSTSPLQTRYLPVGWMYYEGVRCLVQANVSVPAQRVGRSMAWAVEGYPARLAHALIGPRSYKNSDDAERLAARRAMVKALVQPAATPGVALVLTAAQRRACEQDASGDTLDAVLCLVQAAQASQQDRAGIPVEVDPVEGWIIAA